MPLISTRAGASARGFSHMASSILPGFNNNSALAVGHSNSPYVTVYKFNDVTGFGVKYADAATLLPDEARGVAFASDGSVIRVALPQLTEERRKDYIKVAKTKAEDSKISMRNIRRAAKEAMEKAEKDGDISKDDLSRGEKELEKITADHVAKIDELLKHKEAELLEV